MTVGMAVDIPKTEEGRRTLRKLILLLDEAAVYATDAGLFIEGKRGAGFLADLSEYLMGVWRGTNGATSDQ